MPGIDKTILNAVLILMKKDVEKNVNEQIGAKIKYYFFFCSLYVFVNFSLISIKLINDTSTSV